MATLNFKLDDLISREFWQCRMSGRILVSVAGDQTLWCGDCQVDHQLTELSKKDKASYEQQKLQLMGRS